MSRRPPREDPYAALRELLGYAERGGAPADRLNTLAEMFHGVISDATDVSRRKREAREDAKRLASILDGYIRAGYSNGAALKAAHARLGGSRSGFYDRAKKAERYRVEKPRSTRNPDGLYTTPLSNDTPDGPAVPYQHDVNPHEEIQMTKKSLNVKQTSLNTGAGTPASLSKYGPTPRPAPPSYETPRASETGSNGTTGGNFKMPNVSTGPGFAQQGTEPAPPSSIGPQTDIA